MAHIYVYSPAGAVRDRAAFRRGIKQLQALGHEVEIDLDALSSWQRFAGDDATRLAAIGRAAASGTARATRVPVSERPVRASCQNIQAMPTPATAIASQVLAGSR